MRRALNIWLSLLLLVFAAPAAADHDGHEYFAGKLLAADTSMRDPRFTESVIYLVRHDAEGAFGLIINKPLTKLPLAKLFDQLDLEPTVSGAELDLYFGGPVQGELGFVLHSPDFAAKGATMTVQNGLAVSGVRQVLRAIAARKGPEKALFTVGYAGWSSGQLEGELERGDWNIVDADDALIFDLPVADKWQAAHDRRSLKL